MNIKLIEATVLLAIIISCSKLETSEPVNAHAILVYMVGDNNLSNYCDENIKTISDGVKLSQAEYNSVYVYYDKRNSEPRLIKLYKRKGAVRCDTIVKYPETNSASAEQLSQVINDAFRNDKYNSYGLVLWSHATGWLPPNFLSGEFVTQSFGIDNDNEMDIKDLSSALPDRFFEYIIFDACNMGAVEVAFQLRNKTEFILSASTEVAAEGLPYQQIIPVLLSKNRNYKQLAQESYNYYAIALETGVALSLVATAEIENLAITIKHIYANTMNTTADISNIQHFDRYSQHLFFDLEDIIKNIATTEELQIFKNQLNKLVVFAQSPPVVYRVSINTYCGLSSYIYGINPQLDNYYKTLDWFLFTQEL